MTGRIPKLLVGSDPKPGQNGPGILVGVDPDVYLRSSNLRIITKKPAARAQAIELPNQIIE